MISNTLQHLHIITPIVGICVLIIVAALVWAVVQIRNFIDHDFVEKLDCERCMNTLQKDYRDDMDEQYKVLEGKIDQMSRDFSSEMKEVKTSTEQWIQTVIRIEAKVDLLLKGYKH